MKAKIIVLLLLLTVAVYPQVYLSRYIHSFNLVATDQDVGDETYWVISAGNVNSADGHGKVFLIVPCSGEVKVDTLVYTTFVRQKTFTLSFKATDQVGASAISKRKVTLRKDVNGNRIISLVVTVL